MIRVLMVCLGNICRSPLAQGILESKVDSSEVFVDSAGTGAYHIGEKPDVRSIEVAEDHGIDISNQRARKFVVEDFEEFDHIFAMDQANFDTIMSLLPSDDYRVKVKLILSVIDNVSNEVPDPYYGGHSGFRHVFDLLDHVCNYMVRKRIL